MDLLRLRRPPGRFLQYGVELTFEGAMVYLCAPEKAFEYPRLDVVYPD